MEKLDSIKKFDTTSYVSDIEDYYKNLKEEIEVKLIFLIVEFIRNPFERGKPKPFPRELI